MNDPLGHCEVSLAQCVSGIPKALNLPLSTQGTLEMVVTFTPSGMETSAAALAFAQGKSAFGRRGSTFASRRLPGSPGAAGAAASAFGSPPPKGRRLSLTPASVSRVKCFFTASPGSKLSRLQQALPLSPASRRASRASAAARYQDSSPGMAPAAAPAAAPGAAPAAAGASAAASGKTRLTFMLVSSEKREERRHRRRRLAAMIAAARAAVEAGQTDLGALAWAGVRGRVCRLGGWGYDQLP